MKGKELAYSVDTDTYTYQVGYTIFKTDVDKIRRPVWFWSRNLHKPERNYSVSEE